MSTSEAEHELAELLQQRERQTKALANNLKDWSPSDGQAARNHYIAHNTVAEELGVFESERGAFANPPFNEERKKGLLVRGRSDALEAKLNSAQTLDATLRVETLLTKLLWLSAATLGVTIIIAVKLLFL
ncbi:hypothetical protein [Mesorhizobium sp. L-8-3]|uniref:hypothetical protein n=1 Tax=Mesorhizobium sp. L-8-3 TaxID=2744522 RepID=UPI0019276E66|nr:hypothetical protein [Mesorhizobium sp. L-8-3]BCH23523.1 hypothetical protein MesoLjLb_33080 [Mesorhizobium sp. L-8-3]